VVASAIKLGVMGAGAIGCYVGGRLAAGGVDVVFVGRAAAKAELEASGMTLTDLDGASVRVAATDLVFETWASALADRDVVLCCVKSAHTADTATQLANVVPPGAIVVSMQNGVGNADALRATLTEQTVLGGIVGFNVVPRSGGVYRRATSGPLVIEASSDPRVAELAASLVRAGFEVELARDIRARQWSKLVMNLNNAVGALTDAPTKDLVFVKGYRSILAAIIAESLDVMKRANIRPAKLGPIPVHFFPYMLRLPTAVLKVVARAQLKIDPEARSSMWEDVSRGRLTEVDYLNGEIVRLAESCGAAAPLNRRIVEMVHDVEKQGRGSPKLSADALWEKLTT
jgi:2-dehydropantoate 2-reductase